MLLLIAIAAATALFHYYCVVPQPRINPGLNQEDMEARAVFRRCANQKSRENPDVQCPYAATYGDYCHRHYKVPRPFGSSGAAAGADKSPRPDATSLIAAATCIQRAWRRAAPLLRFRAQGPAANQRDLAMNSTELCSMDPVASIPAVYLFSVADSRKVIWAFDIRSLLHMLSAAPDHALQNPYSREPFTPAATTVLHRRIKWLRDRKYNILYLPTDILTEDQIWNQRVLDTFLKIEALGYYANSEWFHDLGPFQHLVFYAKLLSLWEWRLGLAPAEKEVIVPGHGSLFRHVPSTALLGHSKGWWARGNIAIIDAFIGRAADVEHQKLGALYVLMALVQASPAAAAALPWVVESVVG